MVQVITPTQQRHQPSFLQSVIGGLAQGTGPAIQQYQQMKQQQAAGQRDFSQKLALEQNKQNAKYSARLNALKESGLIGNKEESQNETPTGFEASDTENAPPEKSPTKTSMLSGNKPPHSQEEIDAAALFEPTLANTYQRQNEDWNRQRQHQENVANEKTKIARKEALDFHKESAKYDEDLLKSYKRGLNQDIAINDTIKSIKSGNVKPSHLANVFKDMGTWGDKLSSALLNKDEAQIQASIPYLIEGWKEVFGIRLSDADLRVIQDKLPSIGKSPEANLAIARILQKYSKLNKLRFEVGKNIKEKNNGLRPLGYADRVEEQYANMTKPLKVRNPHTGNVVEIPAFEVGKYLSDGGEIIDE